jgi:hypothetical protein
MKYYDGFALIRILQALGAFGNLGFMQGKKQFLQSIPYAMKNIEHFLERTTLFEKLPCLQRAMHSLAQDRSLRAIGV